MPKHPLFQQPEEEDFTQHDISTNLDKAKPEKKERKTKKKDEETEIVTSDVKGERNFYIMIGVVIAMLILLIFGYQLFFGKAEVKTIDELHSENLAGELLPEEGYVYHGFSFVKANDQWWTRFQRANTNDTYNVQLRYGPQELENISIMGDYIYFLHFNATFVTFDPLGENLSYVALAASDISQSLVNVFDIPTFPACTRQDNSSCSNLPIIECALGRPVIYLQQEVVPFVEVKGTCIIVHGQGFELVKAVDRLLLAWYGVMP